MNCTTEATVVHGRIMIVRYRLHGFGTCRKTYKFYDIMKRLFWTQTKIISLNHDISPVGTGRRGDAAKSPTRGKPALATAAFGTGEVEGGPAHVLADDSPLPEVAPATFCRAAI